MQKHLYFICPTDNIEPKINLVFQQEHYYFTSLGNSIDFSVAIVSHISEILISRKIEKISFVLADNNRIISEVLMGENHGNISAIKALHSQLSTHKKQTDRIWERNNSDTLMISYFLRSKIVELDRRLQNMHVKPPKIEGKIYSKKHNSFNSIHSKLIYLDQFNLN